MISEGYSELEVCDDDFNLNSKDQVDLEENQEDQSISERKASIYITASELFNLRRDVSKNKGKDEDVEVYKGPKLYAPSGTSQEGETMNAILQNHRKSLQLQRGAKIRDCMKAEWNEELKVAIVPNLKGKTTQHMGHNFRGKIALSPEEALYLLEKNCIEIKCNNMPMSIEEAYSVMLNGKLGLEKYQVYSHLSQQGFLVVQHQSRVGSKLGEVINSRKRKAVNGTIAEPGEKRLTFTGVLASNSKEKAIVNTESSSLLPESDLFNSSDYFNKFDLVPEDTLNLKTVENEYCIVSNFNEKIISVSSPDNAVSPDSANHIDFVEKDSLRIPISVDTHKDHSVDKVDDAMGVIAMRASSLEGEKQLSLDVNDVCIEMPHTESEKQNLPEVNNSCTEMLQTEKHGSIMVNNTFVEMPQTENAKQNSTEINNSCIETLQKVDELGVSDIEQNNEDIIKSYDKNGTVDKRDGTDDNINETEVDIANDDTDDVIIEGEHIIEKTNEINVDDSYSTEYENEEYEITDESMPIVCEESSEDLDVLSCSISDQQSTYDGFKSVSNDIFVGPSKGHDDEVTLVEVKKKESKPLAVIDLLSDEEDVVKNNDGESLEGSDDEIQVVKVCPVQKNNAQSIYRNLNSVKAECKAERSIIKSGADIKSSFHPQMKFPDLFRKDILCVSRPPVTLLPNNVRPAKEAYVINRKKSQPKARVWESFRDIQDLQRSKRLQRQLNDPNPIRPFSTLRDYRFQNDSHSNRMIPFNREEQFVDQDFNRNNQNFAFQQNRDPFNSPLSTSHELRPTLLPSPDVFSSPNHMPFMSIPNMHNLSSSNPALFVNEIHRTVQSVTSSILSSMLGQHMNHINVGARSSPTFSEPPMVSQHHFNNFASSSPLMPEHTPFNSMQSDFNPARFLDEPMFSGDRTPYGMNRESPYENNWAANNFRQRNVERKGPMFPRAYREFHKKRSWSDIKGAAKGSNAKESDSGSDIEEVPINLNQFLWSNDIQPLVKPGSKLCVSEVLQKLRITQMADLLNKNRNQDRYLANQPGLEISFDVYLPGFKYKKTAPDVPKHRIIVLRSVDPIPKYSETVVLQRKFSDSAMLQMAVVDHGDISFYSFNNISLPDLVPHES